MGRVHQLLRWANKREVARELTRRGFKVSGETLNRWVREKQEIPAVVERLVLELYGIPGTTEEPPPEWAGAMESRIVSEVVANREALYASLAQTLVDAQLGRIPPPDEPPDGKPDRPPGGEGPTPRPTG